MQISFTGAPDFMDVTVGFGNASWHISENLKKFGIEPLSKTQLYMLPGIGGNINGHDQVYVEGDPNIGLSFCPPTQYSFLSPAQYKIGYTPWESTDLQPNWKTILHLCDEIWTTSTWNKEIFESHLNREVFVYLHGVDHKYNPTRRKITTNQPFTFLHMGEPYNRKAGQLVVEAFINLYGNDPRYQLIMKASNKHNLEVHSPDRHNTAPPDYFYSNIKIIKDSITDEQLISLYGSAHCFVYPSWGEGFGFNPLQAMAMGIPTICTSGWAEYANHITLPLESSWARSPWQEVHPGYMLAPNVYQLEQHMKDVVQNYDKYASIAMKNSFKIHEEYDWERVTKPAAERLKNIQKSRF